MTRLRMRQRVLQLALAVLLALVVPPARAQQMTLELDPAKTRVEFTLDAVLQTVHGTFKLKQGTIAFDPATGAASGRVVLDATSAETGNNGRDNKMHKDVLESKRYPEIVFTPTQVQGQIAPQGTSRVTLTGTVNLHGQDHPLVIEVQLQVAQNDKTN
jgi:polyisoprenoid-binding protein YceI